MACFPPVTYRKIFLRTVDLWRRFSCVYRRLSYTVLYPFLKNQCHDGTNEFSCPSGTISLFSRRLTDVQQRRMEGKLQVIHIGLKLKEAYL